MLMKMFGFLLLLFLFPFNVPPFSISRVPRYSGVQYDQGDVRIVLGDMLLMDKGQPLEFDAVAASSYLKGKAAQHGTVCVTVAIGDGPGRGMAWGCDLSYDYVKINAEYTT
jgi:glutamate N-acetyltransferase / amino-acid N-acetyltransferase